MDIEIENNLIRRKYSGSIWYGPAVNSPGHERHGCKPMICRETGRMLGWLMPQVREYHNRLTRERALAREIARLNDTALELIAGVVADLQAEGRAL